MLYRFYVLEVIFTSNMTDSFIESASRTDRKSRTALYAFAVGLC